MLFICYSGISVLLGLWGRGEGGGGRGEGGGGRGEGNIKFDLSTNLKGYSSQ